jgi:hypothetical protein
MQQQREPLDQSNGSSLVPFSFQAMGAYLKPRFAGNIDLPQGIAQIRIGYIFNEIFVHDP